MISVSSSAMPDFRAMVDCKPKVKRCLFGEPDHTQVRAELVKQLSAISRQDADRWSFDFGSGKPIEGGRFMWQKVTPCTEASTREATIRTPTASPSHAVDTESEDEVSIIEPKQTRQATITDFYAHKKRAAVLAKSPKTPMKRKQSHETEPLSPTSRPKRRCRQH